MNETEDTTRFCVNWDSQIAFITIDVREQESCEITLPFSLDDLLAVLNMEALDKPSVNLEEMEGTACLWKGHPNERTIGFTYRDTSPGGLCGTVFYPYAQLRPVLEAAFSKLNRPEVEEEP